MFWIVLNSSQASPGAIERMIVNHPSSDKPTVAEWIKASNMLTRGVKYTLQGPLPVNDPTPMFLAVQRNLLNLSAEAVAAALHNPRGQAGMNRPDQPLDSMGFQKLGDTALPISNDDQIYGDATDGSISDIIQNGGNMMEQPRPDFGQDLNG